MTHHPQQAHQTPAETVSTFHVSAPFINRPVATFLLSIAILLAGAGAYKLLPVASLPQVEFPVISVQASQPGADPETMASAIATPLERQFSRIAGINQMTSTSSLGQTSVIMQFDLTRDINGAARDVQAAINAARSQLPSNLPYNPGYRKLNPADAPILILALTSDTMTVPQMYDQADSILAQKVSQVPGVGQVFVGGSAKPAVRIETNPMQLASYGVGLESLRAVLGTVNVNKPTGYFNGDQRASISTTDQLFGAAAYAPLIVASDKGPVSTISPSNGLPASAASAVNANPGAAAATDITASGAAPITQSFTGSAAGAAPSISVTASTSSEAQAHGTVRIRDIAEVQDGVENIQTGGRYNGKPAILLVVFKAPGANVISAVDSVLAILPRLEASIPPRHQDQRRTRPYDDDPCLRARCNPHSLHLHHPRHPCGVRLPPRGPRDADSISLGAAIAARHLWHHVPAGLCVG